MHVSDETIQIGNTQFNIDFILLPTFKEGMVRAFTWTRFYKRVNWDLQFPTPDKFFTLDLGELLGKHVYQPCPPFILEEEECGEWLTWSIVAPVEGDDIKALAVKAQHLTALSPRRTKIAEHINFPLWAAQLECENQPTIQMSLSPSQEIIKATEAAIAAGMEKIAKAVEEKIRAELVRPPYSGPNRYQGNNFRARREDRQRSPDQRRRSRSPPNSRRSPSVNRDSTRGVTPAADTPPQFQPSYIYNNTPYLQGQHPGLNTLMPQQAMLASNHYGNLQQPTPLPGIGQSLPQQETLPQRQRYGNNQ